ncbi:hypothetical protein D3C72_1331900 [compost metagenome]
MPTWRNRLAMPKVRASSATMGTTRGPSALSLSRPVSMRTIAMVVDISFWSAATANWPYCASGGTATVSAWRWRAGR